jgi:nitrite reductase/ring-hydroxylating ferredoxin subunit/uncharacterized membrane protein
MSENPILSVIEQQDWLQPIQTKGEELVKNAYASAGPAGQTIKNALHGIWLSHPLHSAITDIPVGSWAAAAALDVLEMRGEPKYGPGADAAVAVGLLGALPAALSGMTDWSDTHGKPQRVGAMHGLLNMGAATLYAGSYIARKSEKRGLGRWLGFLGFGLVFASAYLGGELSYTQKIGVNHAPLPDTELPENYTEVTGVTEADLVENQLAKGTADGTAILLVKQQGSIRALANTCSHLGGPLNEGQLEGDSVVCPWHGSRFCLADGHVEDGPATNPQPVLDVKTENGKFLVKARRN